MKKPTIRSAATTTTLRTNNLAAVRGGWGAIIKEAYDNALASSIEGSTTFVPIEYRVKSPRDVATGQSSG